MRNALNNLADTVTDPEEKKLFETEMDNFFALFRRYLNDKAKGNTLWDNLEHMIEKLLMIKAVTGNASHPLPKTRSLTTTSLPTPSQSDS